MSHFVYDSTSLNFPKTDLNVLPVGANPAQYIQASDWNLDGQAAYDLRDAIKNGKYFGFQTQAADPLPSGVSNYVYMTTAGILTVKKGVTTYTVVPSTRQVATGSGLTGGGTLAADLTLSLETLLPSPSGSYTNATITVDAYGRVTTATSGGGVSIGAAVGSGTVGSLLFVGSGVLLQQDNSNLFWDDTNNRLGVGTASPQSSLDVRTGASGEAVIGLTSTASDGFSAIRYFDASSALQGGLGFANASAALTHIAGLNYWRSTGPNFAIANTTTAQFLFGATTSSAFIEFDAGASSAVSAASKGRIIYNQSTNRFQISMNGAAYANLLVTGEGMSIGGTITGSPTVGSVLFIGTGGVLAQDNTNLFWDDTNNRLGVGNATPATALHVTGTARASAGLTVDTMTLGSVWFTGSSGALAQDNANLFWDDTNNRLGIGNAAPAQALHVTGTTRTSAGLVVDTMTSSSVWFTGASGALSQNVTYFTWNDTAHYLAVYSDSATDGSLFLKSTVSTGPAAVGFIDSAGTFKTYVGYFNSGYAFTHFASKNGFFAFGGQDIVLGNSTVAQATFGMAAAQAFMQMAGGSSAAVSTASTGRLRYDTAGQKFQTSHNAGSYFDISTYAAALTSGSVLFANGSNQIAQDNATFFWDTTNKRLGIGLSNPGVALVVVASQTASPIIQVRNTSSSGYSSMDFYDSANALKGGLGYANAAVVTTAFQGKVYLDLQSGVDFLISGAGTPRMTVRQTGDFIVGASQVLTKTGFTSEFTKDAANVVTASAYGTALNAEFMVFRGKGTGASTTAVVSGDVLGAFSFAGATTATAIKSGAFSRALATENWSATANGTKIETYTIPNTTSTALLRTTLDQDGVFYFEGAGFVSKSSSSAAGFFNTAFFAAGGASTSFAQSDRELRVTTGSNAGGQRQQYLTFNGRWSGNIDSPTLTQGIFDRVAAIEFNAAADSLGPNPNSSFNFIVNTGTKGTGSELTVTPTRAMTITYTARVGIGQVNPSQPFDVETILGNTNAKFGSTNPLYIVSGSVGETDIGINAYYNSGWKYGKGSSTQHAYALGFNPTTNVLTMQTTTTAGSADASISTFTTRFSFNGTGDVTIPRYASTTVDAILLSQATSGTLRIQDPTSPGFGYDFTNKYLLIGTHPVIRFASVDVTNSTTNMLNLRSTVAYSSTSGSTIYVTGDLTPTAADQRTAYITMGGWSGGGATYREGAAIKSFSEAAWTAGTSHPSYLAFYTTASASTTAAERMRISAAGTVSIAALTSGSVIFSGASGAISQDNTNFFWDNTNKWLGIQTSSPSHSLDVRANNTSGGVIRVQNGVNGFSAVSFFASDSTSKMALMYGNTGPGAPYAGKFIHFGSVNTLFLDISSNSALEIVPVLNTVSMQFWNGSSASVSAASTGAIRYNTTGQKFQISHNTGSYFDVATYAAALTSGSVLFANGSNQLAQDNSNLFWDNTNKRLGIGNAAPAQALHVTGTGRFTAGLILDTLTTGSILFAGASGAISQDNANFFWDDTNNILKTTHLWLKNHAGFSGSESKTFTNAVQTTDATTTTLQTITLADTTVYMIEISVVARDEAGTERAMYGKKALVYRQGGGATLQGSVQDIHSDVETSAGLDATIDVSSNDARVRVTGLAATTIDWVATINVQAVATNA